MSDNQQANTVPHQLEMNLPIPFPELDAPQSKQELHDEPSVKPGVEDSISYARVFIGLEELADDPELTPKALAEALITRANALGYKTPFRYLVEHAACTFYETLEILDESLDESKSRH